MTAKVRGCVWPTRFYPRRHRQAIYHLMMLVPVYLSLSPSLPSSCSCSSSPISNRNSCCPRPCSTKGEAVLPEWLFSRLLHVYTDEAPKLHEQACQIQAIILKVSLLQDRKREEAAACHPFYTIILNSFSLQVTFSRAPIQLRHLCRVAVRTIVRLAWRRFFKRGLGLALEVREIAL